LRKFEKILESAIAVARHTDEEYIVLHINCYYHGTLVQVSEKYKTLTGSVPFTF
jgi:hypothetical protein